MTEDADHTPLTDAEQAEVERSLARFPEEQREGLRPSAEVAVRHQRPGPDQPTAEDRERAELEKLNAATLARDDLTPDERKEAEFAAARGGSAAKAVAMTRRVAEHERHFGQLGGFGHSTHEAQRNAPESSGDSESRGSTAAPAYASADERIVRAEAPKDAKARTAGGSVRFPYVASEMTRRALRPCDAAIDSIEVDGEPLSARLGESQQQRIWVHHDGHPLFDDGLTDAQGQLVMQGVTRFPQAPRDAPLIVVAQHNLAAHLGDHDRQSSSKDGIDYRKSVFHDLRILGWVTYASTRPIIWDDESGAGVLVTDENGAPRKPREDRGDFRRFRTVAEQGDGLKLYYCDEKGLVDFLRYIVVDPLGDGRRVISKPGWFTHNYQGGYTLSAEHHPNRRVGTKQSYPHAVSSAEYYLARSYDGAGGVAPLLKPVRKGGPGPWTEKFRWSEAMACLLGQRWDPSDTGRNNRALRRFNRMADGLEAKGYTKRGEAGSGDTVEFEVSPSGGKDSGRRPRTIRFRATARGVEAARKAAAREWQSSPLLGHFARGL